MRGIKGLFHDMTILGTYYIYKNNLFIIHVTNNYFLDPSIGITFRGHSLPDMAKALPKA